ncbi:hypothetical protein HanRHA438_MTg0865061 (mitochondrion) [Helianthus annuus]|jgi:hypothetical protein|uniref:Uncharacterized protein n=1 Tax=Helianthus annuus TaxID=4232 RepID=A0A9K3GSY0_HELAN|nr:hypothetical protein HanXRQr2_MTg0834881 [Helianthus annuus]KAJ0427254.1 hypothetical protein HanIR_MTg0917411 [Helianthus annuus]KAJ0818973.1 hypothetical protein HanRHA438_MTg0865061 [Helianthus annuus]
MGESLDFMRRQAQRYPINVVGGTKERGMGDVLEEDLSTEREMELESIAFSTHPPFVSSDLTTLTTSHFTRICSKQYPSQLEEKSSSFLYLSWNQKP